MPNIDTKLKAAFSTISDRWDSDIIPQLERYIAIPNKSPLFDADWRQHGFMTEAMELIVKWCKAQPIEGMSLTVHEDDNRTPLLFIEIDGKIDETILLYGHMDKQPEMKGWDEDKAPWKPVIQDGKLYGRGGADDGYAIFASLTAIRTLQENNIPHGRCVIVIEASEESGSCDLEYYIDKLKPQIGTPSLVICLDSGCGNYEQLWSTTSLRGVIAGKLSIDVLKDGVHSGQGSGIVPSTFTILRELFDRVEDATTHTVTFDALKADIPQARIDQAKIAADALGDELLSTYTFVNQTQPLQQNGAEAILNRTWRPTLSVTGQEGLPPIETAGNVTLPHLSVKISFRLPPIVDAAKAAQALKETFETNPPHHAKVKFDILEYGSGWNAPTLAPWLETANDVASNIFFDKPAAYMGEGGSIPFMGMLGDLFPDAQFLIAGVLGPKSNAHGPNEFLHINMAKRLTGCVASVIASHFESHQS